MQTWWRILAVSVVGCAFRGGVAHQVDLADLAPLAPDHLAALQDEEHGLAVARTMLAGAHAEEERADARVDAARTRRKELELEREVVRANLDAAKESGDKSRLGLAKGRAEEVKRSVDAAQAAERWQNDAADATREATRLAEARVNLREAELEMARFELLEQSDQGRRYMRSNFTDQLAEAQQNYDEAQRRYDEAEAETMRAYDRWRQLDPGAQG